MDICDTGNRYDRTNLCFLYFYFIQTFKLIELTDLNFAELVRLMMVDDDAVLIYFQVTVVDLTNADTSYILVVINRTDQNLCLCIRISLRRRDVIQMIPVPDNCLTQLKYNQVESFRSFSNEKEKTDYVYLLQKEKALIDNVQDTLQNKAMKLYQKCIAKPDSSLAARCCDFKMLEEKCSSYSDT